MLKPLATFAALAILSAAAAFADTHATTPSSAAQAAQQQNLPPVDTMTCDQMSAEMMTAGQQMNSHLDPQFATDANAMQQEAQQKQREAMAQAANPMCYVPFLGAAACAAQQQRQQQQAQADAPRQQARMQAQMDRLNNSMAGMDQNRMMAISNRFQAQHCQAQMQQSGQMPH